MKTILIVLSILMIGFGIGTLIRTESVTVTTHNPVKLAR